MALKSQFKACADPAERRRLEAVVLGLKLILNTVFGQTGNAHSPAYDPTAAFAVMITGQLLMLGLIERLRAIGVEVVATNTDGLVIKARRDDEAWRGLLDEWQEEQSLGLEINPIERFLTTATNRYGILDSGGHIKWKGELLDDTDPAKVPDFLIVADACCGALLQDKCPEDIILRCLDPVRFCNVTTRSKGQALILKDTMMDTEVELHPRVVRWYKAKDSGLDLYRRKKDGTVAAVPHARGIRLLQNLPEDGGLPEDLDRDWYLNHMRLELTKCHSARHQDHRLAQDPRSQDLLQAGLCPTPYLDWSGRSTTTKPRDRRPCFVGDLSQYPTLATWTGPFSRVLAIEIVEPRLWSDFILQDRLLRSWDPWADFQDAMVVTQGGHIPQDVRTGRASGTLLFRLDGGDDHPLAKMPAGRWRKRLGIRIAYGHVVVPVEGPFLGTTLFRHGVLGQMPDWLLQNLTPLPRIERGGLPALAVESTNLAVDTSREESGR